MKHRKYSAFTYTLLALVPYSRPNLELAFHPNKFFNELEKISGAKRSSLHTALSRAQRQGLVERENGKPFLTSAGLAKVRPYRAQVLNKDAVLLIIFDIPEQMKNHRRQFRNFLKGIDVVQVQKSVWATKLDHRESLRGVIKNLEIDKYVVIYEAAKVTL